MASAGFDVDTAMASASGAFIDPRTRWLQEPARVTASVPSVARPVTRLPTSRASGATTERTSIGAVHVLLLCPRAAPLDAPRASPLALAVSRSWPAGRGLTRGAWSGRSHAPRRKTRNQSLFSLSLIRHGSCTISGTMLKRQLGTHALLEAMRHADDPTPEDRLRIEAAMNRRLAPLLGPAWARALSSVSRTTNGPVDVEDSPERSHGLARRGGM